MPSIIGNITCNPSSCAIGQSVLVQVQPANGLNFDTAIDKTVYINGVPGSSQYLQFVRPGKIDINVDARTLAGTERKSTTVTVKSPTPNPTSAISSEHTIHIWPEVGLPLLHVAHLPQQQNLIGFGVGQMPQLELHAGIPTIRSSTLFRLPEIQLPPPGTRPEYYWDFGDGSTIDTLAPSVQHDYTTSLNPLIEHQSFDVSVTRNGYKVTRTLTFINLYAYLKRSCNRLHPPASASGYATRFRDGFYALMTVTNLEDKVITLEERRYFPSFSDTSRLAEPTVVESINPIALPPGQLITLSVNVSFDEIPRESIGFAVHFFGKGPTGEEVRVSAHFDLKPSQLLLPDLQILAANDGAASKMIHDALVKNQRTRMTLSELREPGKLQSLLTFEALRAQQSTPNHLRPPGPALSGIGGAPQPAPPPDGSNLPVVVNGPCDPDNLPDDVPPGLVCQATTQTKMVPYHGRYMNAFKGDTILAPGGNGLVGRFITQLNQKYSHCGIMTRNFDEITHCTSSEDRVQAYPVGSILCDGPEPTQGFRPDVVQYQWPGVIQQTVENSVLGELRPDPEGGTNYSMQDFNAGSSGEIVGGNWIIVPSVVVQPDPKLETRELRLRLHAVADDALAQKDKMHYRLFGYTDPTIEQTELAPAESGWAGGTSPGVCSSFIWAMMKRNKFQLTGAGPIAKQSDLTPNQVAEGAQIGPATPDGLYLYTEADRTKAAVWLQNAVSDTIIDKIHSKAGTFSGWVNAASKIIEHVTNQLLNTFAFDHVQVDDDNETWRSPKSSNAVSPDNIMLWNGPDGATPGPYGYFAEAVWRQPTYELVTVSQWKLVQQSGRLSGSVSFQGAPVADALVIAYDGKSSASNNDGIYSIDNIPFGTYILKTQKVTGQGLLTASVNVDVEAPSVQQNIVLNLPSDLFRTVLFNGKLRTHYTFSSPLEHSVDQVNDMPFYLEARVGPFGTHAVTGTENDVNTAKANLSFVIDWQLDKSVNVSWTLTLHSGSVSNHVQIPENNIASWSGSINSENDDTETSFTISNTVSA